MRSSSALLVVVVAACGEPAGPIVPVHLDRPELQYTERLNGKFQNLRFEPGATPRIAVGTKGFHIGVSRSPRDGHYVVGETWPENARVRFELPEGIAGQLDAAFMPHSFDVNVDCVRPGTFELRVELSAPGVTVADAIDVECIQADRLVPSEEPAQGARTFVGGFVQSSARLYAGQLPLAGEVELEVKPGEPLEQVNAYTFKTLRAGRDPVLTSVGLEYAVPIEIVDVPWSISVGPLTQPGRCALYYEVAAIAVDAQGAPLLGLGDCTFTAVEGQTSTVLPATADY
ncbi:MAG: hypothetical protein JNK82_12975, partial [Myxococcaceae bacterium]|nr:hypothetical protein [Myxococcaceae bacterium]